MPVNLGYSLTGRGGDAFWWLDNSGSARWSALPAQTFDLFPGATDDWRSQTSGSYLLSTPFALTAAQVLTVTARMVVAHAQPFYDVGFALLLHGSTIKAVLFAARPDAVNHRGDLGGIPGTVFAAKSAGVTGTTAPGGLVKMMLGGVEYGLAVDPSDCTGNCSCDVAVSYTPGAGTFHLLFGMFQVGNTGANNSKPAAMVVTFAGV